MMSVLEQKDRQCLVTIFGGDYTRISQIRAVIEAATGEQTGRGTCLNACRSVEEVLEDLGLKQTLREAQEQQKEELKLKVDQSVHAHRLCGQLNLADAMTLPASFTETHNKLPSDAESESVQVFDEGETIATFHEASLAEIQRSDEICTIVDCLESKGNEAAEPVTRSAEESRDGAGDGGAESSEESNESRSADGECAGAEFESLTISIPTEEDEVIRRRGPRLSTPELLIDQVRLRGESSASAASDAASEDTQRQRSINAFKQWDILEVCNHNDARPTRRSLVQPPLDLADMLRVRSAAVGGAGKVRVNPPKVRVVPTETRTSLPGSPGQRPLRNRVPDSPNTQSRQVGAARGKPTTPKASPARPGDRLRAPLTPQSSTRSSPRSTARTPGTPGILTPSQRTRGVRMATPLSQEDVLAEPPVPVAPVAVEQITDQMIADVVDVLMVSQGQLIEAIFMHYSDWGGQGGLLGLTKFRRFMR